MADCHTRGKIRAEWRTRADGLAESVQFMPGYNCTLRSMLGHGVHSMEICWLLRGPAGAVGYSVQTDWTPGELYPGHGLSPDGTKRPSLWWPYPRGIQHEYHARRPHYEHQGSGHCELIGGPCYSDTQLSATDELAQLFVAEGEHVIWAELQRRYQSLVDEETNARDAERQT